MKVCMFVRNPITNDPRVKGEAVALRNAGHAVTIIGASKGQEPREEYWDGIRLLRFANPIDEMLAERKVPRDSDAGAERLGSQDPPSLAHTPTATTADTAPAHDRRLSWIMKFKKRIGKTVYRAAGVWQRRRFISAGIREKADVYHAHDLNMLDEAGRAARRTGGRLVYDSHELWDRAYMKKLRPARNVKRWEKTEAFWIKKADIVITVCDGIADALKIKYNLGNKPVVVRNCARLQPRHRTDRLRKDFLPGNTNRPIILYQGVIQHGRGLDLIGEVAREAPRADFAIIGPVPRGAGDLVRSLEHKKSALGNLFVLPPVPYQELWEVTASADIGIVPTQPIHESYRQSQPNKIFEYMIAGLAIVATDLPGHRDIISQLPAGDANPILLIPHDDPGAAARLVNDLLDNPERIRKMGDNAYRAACDVFNREREMAKLLAAYSQLQTHCRGDRSSTTHGRPDGSLP